MKMKFITEFIILFLGSVLFSYSSDEVIIIDAIEVTTSSRVETFTFSSNGTITVDFG